VEGVRAANDEQSASANTTRDYDSDDSALDIGAAANAGKLKKVKVQLAIKPDSELGESSSLGEANESWSTAFARLNLEEIEMYDVFNGNPLSFFYIQQRIPIVISANLQRVYSFNVLGFNSMYYNQATQRILNDELAKQGIDYSLLPKLLNASTYWCTMPGDAWRAYRLAYEAALALPSDTPKESHYRYSHNDTGHCLSFPRILENHKEFVFMLYRDFEMSHSDYMRCVISAFATDGLYFPYNTPQEIILCARKNALQQR